MIEKVSTIVKEIIDGGFFMIVTIHQPEHMPWLGFFHKVFQADIFIVLDNIQFRKNYFQNRNKIRTKSKEGWSWITVPVSFCFGDLINDVTVNKTDGRWKRKYWDTIEQSYCKADYFKTYSEELKSILEIEWQELGQLNLTLIKKIFEFLDLKKEVLLSSELNVIGESSDLLLKICKKLNASHYVSGISGKEYLDIENFISSGINVTFQEFYHPIYNQLHGDFISCMSVIDLLFNHGEKSLDIINGVNTPVMKEVFL